MTDIATSLLQGYFQFAHNWFAGTLQGLTPEIAHWQPPGKAHPIAAEIVHVVTTEDYLINVILNGGAPLMATSFAGKTGFTEMPPVGNRDDWAGDLVVDLPALDAYRAAVFANTEAAVGALSDADLDRPVDLSMAGMGTQNAAMLLNLLLLNVHNHCGEISCLKGLNGLQGYPG